MNAQMEYMEADTAATAAENAATAAEMAADAAEAAHMGIDSAGSADDAQAAQMTAETRQGEAADEAMTASTQQMTAETAQSDAMMASETHVIGLLIRANGQHITEPRGDDSNTANVDESMTVEELRTAATELMATALNTAAAAADNGEASTTAVPAWLGDIAANPDATPPTEAMPGALSIAVDPANSGTAMTFRMEAAEDDPATDGVDESMTMPKTASKIAGLGDFMYGFSISDGTRHAIVFTDKDQDDPPVAGSARVTFRYVEDEAVTTVAELTLGDDKTGPLYTGVTWTPSGEEPLTGTLSCPEGTTNCDIQIDADGAITAIEGYVFTGSREAKDTVTAMTAEQQAAANADYLVFGVWLREDTLDFGAFATGGSTAPAAAEITGTATYEGSATGVYTAGSSVDYFQGDATLTANFGAPGTDTDPTAADDEAGTITGMIDNIVAGGNDMTDVIYLNDDGTPADGNIEATGTFAGDARMGTATTVDNVTTHTHNGSWSGQFFNGTADDDTTGDVNESHVAPDSVAGTFGVTGTVGEGDDAVTRSYLGAFGAHCSTCD